MKVKALFALSSFLLWCNVAQAEYQPLMAPAVCAPNKEVLDDLREDGFKIWAVSKLVQDGVSLTMAIWRKGDAEITVTTQRSGSGYTCIVAWGDTDTVIVDWDKLKQTF
jgi:hypothetical protein